MKKKDILSIIDSLEKINSSVARNLESNILVTTETLVDCQNAAIGIGNEIEKRGQAGEEIVHLLESYCENIYQMNCSQTDTVRCRKLAKKIQKQLVQTRNEIKYNLPDDKKQVVFLPYKASMWDSLESVWKAADADPDCDAYVVPIPYFDKNPDGSFREMHYEGDEYPDYVPIVPWEEYNVAVEHPDVIYIHNPYDEFNLVTSVHPDYYSKELKKHTNELVYIPYFILKDIEPDDQAAVHNMEHFCAVPAVVHADKVIVQSEKMKQVYINVMSKMMGEDTRKIWEKKVFGSGSPKIGKLLNTRKEDLDIPTEWLKIIEKPDGSWKKVIFYNTGIAALLQYKERWIEKIEEVLEIFKEYTEEITLLWRPHPLIENTMKSMRPRILEKYRQIRKYYIEEKWGIYDDTADLDRAIVISDAYYGDGSSVIPLFIHINKVVLMQNPRLILKKCFSSVYENQDSVQIYSGNMVIEGNMGWCYGLDFGKLFQVNLSENQITDIIEMPRNLFTAVAYTLKKKGHNIYFFPRYGSGDILLYDFSKKTCSKIELKNLISCQAEKIFTEVYELEGKFYAVEWSTQQIIEYDVMNEKVVGVYQWNGLEKLCEALIQVKDKIYGASSQKSVIASFDMLTKEIYYYRLDNIDAKICLIAYINAEFWIVCNNKIIYIYNENLENLLETIELPDGLGIYCDNELGETVLIKNCGTQTLFPLFNKALVFGNTLWLVPSFANSFVHINITDRKVQIVKTERTNKEYVGARYSVEGVFEGKYAYLYCLEAGERIRLNLEKGKIENCQFLISQEKYRELIEARISRDEVSEYYYYHKWNQQWLVRYLISEEGR